MTASEYTAILQQLGLQPAARRTAALLGLSVRQAQRLASGEQTVSDTVARLLAMYVEHGLPDERRA